MSFIEKEPSVLLFGTLGCASSQELNRMEDPCGRSWKTREGQGQKRQALAVGKSQNLHLGWLQRPIKVRAPKQALPPTPHCQGGGNLCYNIIKEAQHIKMLNEK